MTCKPSVVGVFDYICGVYDTLFAFVYEVAG